MPPKVSFKLNLIVKECWTNVAAEISAWRNLSFHLNSMRAQMLIQLRDRMKFLRTMTAHVLLNFMVRLHVTVEICHLSE